MEKPSLIPDDIPAKRPAGVYHADASLPALAAACGASVIDIDAAFEEARGQMLEPYSFADLAATETIKSLLDGMVNHESLLTAHLFGGFNQAAFDQAMEDVLHYRPSREAEFEGAAADFYRISFNYASIELMHAKSFIEGQSVEELSALKKSGREWTRFERVILHGDTSDDYKNRHIHANDDLIARLDAGEKLSKDDAKRARRIKRDRAAGATWC